MQYHAEIGSRHRTRQRMRNSGRLLERPVENPLDLMEYPHTCWHSSLITPSGKLVT